MSLEELIKQRIRARGPITVADYMELALAHPDYGYYMRRDPLGADGDFTTSPEISQIFGELIGAWLAGQWLVMGKPKAALVELGPGRGTLMDDALRATKSVAGFHDAISLHLVETSPVLMQKQQDKLTGKHPDVHWHTTFDDIPPKPLLLIANEFFDALPVRQYIYSEKAWRERMVGMEGEKLAFVIPALRGDPGHTDDGANFPRSPRKAGMTVERCAPAHRIAHAIGSRITTHGGAALIIDYGYTGGSRGDTLQAVKRHQYHDVLTEAGTADLTAHVDFDALKQAVESAGASVYGPQPQGVFLTHIGAAERVATLSKKATEEQKSAMLSALERLTSPEQMGTLFKVLCLTHPQHPKPEGF